MSLNEGVKVVKILGRNHLRCMVQHARECWENESYSNVTFVCKSDSGSQLLSANKAVLATSSRKLQFMLADTGDEDVDIIVPDESDFDSIKLLLQYIYTGEVHTNGLLKDQLESLITDWEIGYPEITPVPSSSPDYSAEFDTTSALSSPAIIAKKALKKNGRKKQKKSDSTIVENESLWPTESDATPQNDPPESKDSEEDKADLLLSEAFHKEERSRNQQLTKTAEEIMDTIKRHQLYMNHFVGPQEFTAPKITETKKQLSRDVRISCTTCGKQVCRRYMEYHMLTTHGNERPFLCEQCGAGFAMLIGLNHHLKLSHPNESQMQKFTCTLCDRVCRSKEGLKFHMMTHTNVKRFACSICDKRFRFQASLRKHNKLIHATEKTFSCNYCDRRFLNESTYTRHLKTHDESRLKTRLKKPTSAGPFICGTCGISFRREYGILVHEAQHKNEDPKLPCRRCPEIFSSLKLLRDHVRNQHQDSIFKCQHCPNYYSTKIQLEEHTLIHTDTYEEPAATFPCNQCGKSFQSQMKVDSHIKFIHAAERPFKCRFCSKDFRHKHSFLEHQRGHTGEKPYYCPHCPNTYRTNRQAKIHIRTHTGEKPYVCGQCGNSFTSSEGLRMHTKIHTGDKIQCATCGQVFRSKVKLKDHEQTHHDEDLGKDVDGEEESD